MHARSFPTIRRGLAALGVAALLSLTGCDLTEQLAIANKLANAKPEERAKVLAEIPPDEQAKGLQFVYGRDLIYLSPEAQAQLFSSEENFIFGVLAGYAQSGTAAIRYYLTSNPTRAANTADILAILDSLPAIWKSNLATLRQASGNFVEARRAAIIARIGKSHSTDYINKMDDLMLRDLIWDDAKFSQFMYDDKYAINYVATAYATKQVSDNISGGNFKGKVSSHIFFLTKDGLGPAGGGSSRTGT